ncbi:hypothetical protein PROFUN_06414 [Planoprotostelium fungivorum]|uniref:Uncharacterized protein n=1 Tax=Planoprotostelium fungivorum TaxID=1890364 RepID=A0A2P6NNU5_9EUKA|nr:hypothetical protein PROFUN_06414 [Planoprotostelium fungivorum]
MDAVYISSDEEERNVKRQKIAPPSPIIEEDDSSQLIDSPENSPKKESESKKTLFQNIGQNKTPTPTKKKLMAVKSSKSPSPPQKNLLSFFVKKHVQESPKPTLSQQPKKMTSEEIIKKESKEQYIDDSDEDFESTPKASEFKRNFILPSEKAAEGPQEPFVLDEDPLVQIPGSINSKLRDYQREGVKFLYSHYRNNSGAILGDDMGLGKTIQTIAFVCSILGVGGKTEAKSRFFTSAESKENLEHVLIVMPGVFPFCFNVLISLASVLTQWEREIRKWTCLRVSQYHGNKREEVLTRLKRDNINVMLTSYETFRIDQDNINVINWKCIIFDEVHKIKNKGSKVTQSAQSIRTTRRYGLTGTVIQNSFDELWTLVDFICPNYLGSLQDFRLHYIQNIKNGQRHDATYNQIAKGRLCSKRLSEKIKKIVIRRDKTLIADTLPGKEDHVIFCSLTPVQLAIYQRILKSPDFEFLRRMGEKCNCGSQFKRVDCCHKGEAGQERDTKKILLPAITRLLKVANHPALLVPDEKKAGEKYDNEKAFSQMAFGENAEEIEEMLKNGDYERMCTKLKVLKSLLPIWNKKKEKVLLFSYSTRVMDILAKFLRKEKHTFHRLDGSTSLANRQKLVDNFNSSPSVSVFLISTKAGGLGLNLVSANIVVVFDPNWNVSHDLQAQDRAYRIGQKKRTKVYRMIAAGTIEEMIYNRQVYKQQLANIGMHGGNERRYFTGVQGQKGQEGEIFGAANLLKLITDAVMTDEIIKRTQRAEEEFHIEESKDNEKEKEGTDMELLLNSDHGEVDENMEELLHSSGVVYSHLNNSMVGESKAEKRLLEQATREYQEQLSREEQARRRKELLDQELARFQQMAPRNIPYNNLHLPMATAADFRSERSTLDFRGGLQNKRNVMQGTAYQNTQYSHSQQSQHPHTQYSQAQHSQAQLQSQHLQRQAQQLLEQQMQQTMQQGQAPRVNQTVQMARKVLGAQFPSFPFPSQLNRGPQ